MPNTHRIRLGDCISSVAFEHGFAPETLWEQPENDGLRAIRPNMFQLVEGDEVHVPDIRPRIEKLASGASYEFRRLGVPERLVVEIRDEAGAPRAGLPYSVVVDAVRFEGTTDAKGRIEHWIAPDALMATLTLTTDQGPEQHVLMLGHHQPAMHDELLLARLRRLDLLGPESDPQSVIAALRGFQAEAKIPETGDFDLATSLAMDREDPR